MWGQLKIKSQKNLKIQKKILRGQIILKLIKLNPFKFRN